jgi:hypothetical protein
VNATYNSRKRGKRNGGERQRIKEGKGGRRRMERRRRGEKKRSQNSCHHPTPLPCNSKRRGDTFTMAHPETKGSHLLPPIYYTRNESAGLVFIEESNPHLPKMILTSGYPVTQADYNSIPQHVKIKDFMPFPPLPFLIYLLIYFLVALGFQLQGLKGSHTFCPGQPGTMILLLVPLKYLALQMNHHVCLVLWRWGLTKFLSWLQFSHSSTLK